MAKPRVYELAKVLNVDSKTVLEKLKDMGEFVKSASSTIEPPVARRLKAEFAKDNAKGDSKPVQQRRPGRTFGPGFHFIFRTDSGRSRTSGIACLGISAGSDSGCTDTGVRRAAHAPGMPTPGRHGQNDNRENGRDNREGRENGRQSRPERSP